MIASTLTKSLSRRTLPRVAARGYHDNIVEHYENPRNVGSLDKNDDTVGTVRFPECFRSSICPSLGDSDDYD